MVGWVWLAVGKVLGGQEIIPKIILSWLVCWILLLLVQVKVWIHQVLLGEVHIELRIVIVSVHDDGFWLLLLLLV